MDKISVANTNLGRKIINVEKKRRRLAGIDEIVERDVVSQLESILNAFDGYSPSMLESLNRVATSTLVMGFTPSEIDV